MNRQIRSGNEHGRCHREGQSRKARKRGVKHLYAPDVTKLYPREGNVHEFVAGELGAAMLDVLLPPYDTEHDRDCTFYEENGETMFQGETCLLAPISQPLDFHCTSGRYLEIGS